MGLIDVAATGVGAEESATATGRGVLRRLVYGVLTVSVVATGLAVSQSPAFADECTLDTGVYCGEVINKSSTPIKVAPNRTDAGVGTDSDDPPAKITEIKNGESSRRSFKDADAYLVPKGCWYTPEGEVPVYSNGSWVVVNNSENVVIANVKC